MKAKSIKGSSPDEIEVALQESMADGFKPTLAIVFLSVKQDREAVCDIFSSKDIDIIGATSSGEFINGYQSQGESAILLLDASRNDYSIFFESTKEIGINSAVVNATNSALSKFPKPGLILLSTCLSDAGEMFDGRALIHSLENAIGNDVEIFGGMAGADGTLAGTYVFDNKHSTDEGFVLLALNSEKISLIGSAISGWKPIGKVRTVTKCDDEWIYEIDGQPALDMYLRYLGQTLNNEDESGQIFFVEDIGFFHPFIAINSGEPILRTPMEVSKEKKALKLDFTLHEGEQLQFTLPPDFDIIETILDNASQLKHQQNVDGDALLVFSCLGRLSALGPLITEENEGLHKIWNAPMAGFYTYGEYGNGIDNNYKFHSTTCSWVALKEK